MRLVLSGLFLLAGCASSPVAPVATDSESFALNGRVAIRHGDQRHSAGLRWVHRAGSDELLVQGPLGQTAARVYGDARGAVLDEGGRHLEAADIESLMLRALGWQLPLGGLHRWLIGLAADAGAEIERDEHGRIAVLRQDGWEVRYLGYRGEAADSLPTRLQLSRDGLQVLLLIDEWEK